MGQTALSFILRKELLLSPAVLIIGCFLIAPLFIVLVYSFLTPGTYGGVIWEGTFDAYIQFLFERDFFDESLTFSTAYLEIYSRSFVQALVATVACFLIGFPTAYFIATRPEAQKNMWILLVTVPYWINLLIRTIAMLFLIRDQGPLNHALISMGLIETPIHIAYTNFGVGIGLVYSYLPFMVLPLYATIERFDFRLVEAAHDLYANRWTVLGKIIMPLCLPGIVAGSLLVFIPSLGAYVTPDILGGAKTTLLGNYIVTQFGAARNWPFGSALSGAILIVMLLATIVYFRTGGKTV